MQFIHQELGDIVASLKALDSTWQDDVSKKAVETLESFPQKQQYSAEDVGQLLDKDFNMGILICRLFLGLSKDEMETALSEALQNGGIGVKRYRKDPSSFLQALEDLGLYQLMAAAVNHQPVWSDLLVERLRSTRGKAIRGQTRGRGLEDFAEAVVREVFGNNFHTRCNFTGPGGEVAKCDFAIPDREMPRILIEAKGYGATGSKMTDVLGDLNIIVRNKRNDTTLILVTDGVTWRRRLSDLRKIVEMQNRGEITRIYTTSMVNEFRRDLQTLKLQYGL